MHTSLFLLLSAQRQQFPVLKQAANPGDGKPDQLT